MQTGIRIDADLGSLLGDFDVLRNLRERHGDCQWPHVGDDLDHFRICVEVGSRNLEFVVAGIGRDLEFPTSGARALFDDFVALVKFDLNTRHYGSRGIHHTPCYFSGLSKQYRRGKQYRQDCEQIPHPHEH